MKSVWVGALAAAGAMALALVFALPKEYKAFSNSMVTVGPCWQTSVALPFTGIAVSVLVAELLAAVCVGVLVAVAWERKNSARFIRPVETP